MATASPSICAAGRAGDLSRLAPEPAVDLPRLQQLGIRVFVAELDHQVDLSCHVVCLVFWLNHNDRKSMGRLWHYYR